MGCCEIGTHKHQIVLEPPFGGKVGIEKCIIKPILKLWNQGIKTKASCCGHCKTNATVSVDINDEIKMDKLGYKYTILESNIRAYIIKKEE